VGALRSADIVPPDELLEAGQAVLAAGEDLEVEALAQGRLDPAFGLAVGLGVRGAGPGWQSPAIRQTRRHALDL
jgi:hypothetical protein